MGAHRTTREIREEASYPPAVVAVAEFSQRPVDLIYQTYLKLRSRRKNSHKARSSSAADDSSCLRYDVMSGASFDPDWKLGDEDDVIDAQRLLKEIDATGCAENHLPLLLSAQEVYKPSDTDDNFLEMETDGDREATSESSLPDVTRNDTSTSSTMTAAASLCEDQLGPGTVGAAIGRIDDLKAPHRMLKEKLWALRAENRKLKARQICRECRQRPVELTLLPCGHFCFCQQCGSSFHACPICRRTILADVKTIVS